MKPDSEYQKLDVLFKTHVVLVIDGEEQKAELLTRSQFEQRVLKLERRRVVDLDTPLKIRYALEAVAAHFGTDGTRTFTMEEIARDVARVEYRVAHHWLDRGILAADGEGSNRKVFRVSYTTAVIAFICGGLYRRQHPPIILKLAADEIRRKLGRKKVEAFAATT